MSTRGVDGDIADHATCCGHKTERLHVTSAVSNQRNDIPGTPRMEVGSFLFIATANTPCSAA